MATNRAKEYFSIKPKQYNCAQSVLKALAETHPDIDKFSEFGGGRAPGGLCGALYAALQLAPAEKHEAMKKEFAGYAGSLSCRDIRKTGKLSCLECVEEATALNLKHN